MSQYSFEHIQKSYHQLNLQILKEELDKNHLTCSNYDNNHIHKNGRTFQGVQRYKCK